MKVTKRKTNYGLRLSISEFEMLKGLVDAHDAKAAKAVLKGNAQGAYTRRAKLTGGDILAVDADVSDRVSTSTSNFGRVPAPAPAPIV